MEPNLYIIIMLAVSIFLNIATLIVLYLTTKEIINNQWNIGANQKAIEKAILLIVSAKPNVDFTPDFDSNDGGWN